ncbi:hypothetical protein JTB14_009427 [Gonioctena quinquepunctata]|nr:hypothetical protein JTB14_009427 [Gonioctena quinquepunctata]
MPSISYSTNENNLKKYGQGASVVLHLSERLGTGNGDKLYYDNYFSSYDLFILLKDKNIYAAGTIRTNRFFKPPLMTVKEMKKKNRGFSEEIVYEKENVVIVKRFDNKPVCLATNDVGKETEDVVKCTDDNQSKYTEVTRPEIIHDYNHGMGGVHLMDQLISYHRIFIRSKKWLPQVIMHMIDFALVNSWIEYKKDCDKFDLP